MQLLTFFKRLNMFFKPCNCSVLVYKLEAMNIHEWLIYAMLNVKKERLFFSYHWNYGIPDV